MNGMILKMEIFHLFILFRSSLIFFMCRKKKMKIYTAKCWIVMVSEMNVAWWGYVVRILILNIASGKNNVKWIISQFKKKMIKVSLIVINVKHWTSLLLFLLALRAWSLIATSTKFPQSPRSAIPNPFRKNCCRLFLPWACPAGGAQTPDCKEPCKCPYHVSCPPQPAKFDHTND